MRHGTSRGDEIVAVGRRSLEGVSEQVITDFREPFTLPEADAAICALGTTMAKAGSRAAFYSVDHDAVLRFAGAAHAAGIEHFLLVSAVGANTRSPVYYSRVKGDVERAIEDLGFKRLDVAQPGLLLGDRVEQRRGEDLMQRWDPLLRKVLRGPLDRYAGIGAVTVAQALLALSIETAPGYFRHENRGLQALAASF